MAFGILFDEIWPIGVESNQAGELRKNRICRTTFSEQYLIRQNDCYSMSTANILIKIMLTCNMDVLISMKDIKSSLIIHKIEIFWSFRPSESLKMGLRGPNFTYSALKTEIMNLYAHILVSKHTFGVAILW